MTARKLWLPLVCILLLAAASARADEPFTHEISLTEHLGHGWGAQLVHRRVRIPRQGILYADKAALYRQGRPLPMQFDRIDVYPDGSIRAADVWFRTELPAHAERRFVLRAEPPAEEAAATDMRVTQRGSVLEVGNAHVAVRLPAGQWQVAKGDTSRTDICGALHKHLELAREGQPEVWSEELLPGPILGVRLPSGRWTAPFYLQPQEKFALHIGLLQPVDPKGPAGRLQSYATRILTQGPLFVRAQVTYTFDGGEYTTTVTVRCGEPFVRIDERYRNAGALVIDLSRNFAPSRAVYKTNRVKAAGRSVSIPPENADRRVGLLVGWDFFFEGIAPAWGLMGDPEGDVLGMVSTDADWLPYPYNQGLHIVARPDGGVSAKGSLGSGRRHWALSVHTESGLTKPNPTAAFYDRWYRSMVMPLDKVANWTLVWSGMSEQQFPHTFFSAGDLRPIREQLRQSEVISQFMKTLPRKRFTDAAAHWLYGSSIEKAPLTDPGKRYVDALPSLFLEKLGYWDDSRLNYMQITDELLLRYVGIELLLGSDALTETEKRTLLTKLAFVQNLMNDTMFWPPNYPYNPQEPEPYPAYVQGTPNQKICYVTARGILACVLKTHPDFELWVGRTLQEFDRVASGSVAPSGAHLESPFYSSRDTIRFGPFMTALVRAGVGGKLQQQWFERMKSSYRYLGDMLTPPEPRMGGVRVYHPIGRSSSGVVDPTMMIASEPFGRGDVDYVRNMRRRWQQQGRPAPDITGNTGGRDMSLTMLAAVEMLRRPPSASTPFRSRRWKGMGAVMRSQAGSDFESNVIFRHDPFCWNLYEANNGAVYFYGKGAPLLPRFGAYWMAQKGQPNLMSIPFGNRLLFRDKQTAEPWTNGLGKTTHFASLGDIADVTTGITRDGHWQRSVLFAKDAGREDPVYLLVRDAVSRPGAATALHWWVMSKQVQPDGVEKPGVVPTKGSDEGWLANLGKNWENAPDMQGQYHHFTGQCGVNLDMFIALPTTPTIVTDAVGVGPRMPYCVNPKLYEYQQLVRIEQGPKQDYLTLLVPRRPNSQQPRYETIAEGAGVAVSRPGAEDRLFQSAERVKYDDDVVAFEGLAGFARTGGEAPLRLMIFDGRISAGGVSLACKDAAAAVLKDRTLTIHCSREARDLDVQVAPELRGVTIRFRRER